jgi:hypothetical protein
MPRFLRSPQIANPQIFGLIPRVQSANILDVPVGKSQICKFLLLIRKSRFRKFLQNTGRLFQNSPKRGFKKKLILYLAFYAIFLKGKPCIFADSENLVCKSQKNWFKNRKTAKCNIF